MAGDKGFLSGPYAHRPALDEVVQMMSGLAAMTGTRDKPQRVGSSADHIMGGMFGAIAILAALYQKRGGKKDGAESASGCSRTACSWSPAHGRIRNDRPQAALDAGARHAWPIYDIFDTAGGERIFIGVVTEGHWWSFCRDSGCRNLPTTRPRNTTERTMARDGSFRGSPR